MASRQTGINIGCSSHPSPGTAQQTAVFTLPQCNIPPCMSEPSVRTVPAVLRGPRGWCVYVTLSSHNQWQCHKTSISWTWLNSQLWCWERGQLYSLETCTTLYLHEDEAGLDLLFHEAVACSARDGRTSANIENMVLGRAEETKMTGCGTTKKLQRLKSPQCANCDKAAARGT